MRTNADTPVEQNALLAVGRMSEEKGLLSLFRAILYLASQQSPCGTCLAYVYQQ